MPLIDSPQTEALARYLDLGALRTQLITSNLANIDTPGYRTRDINFRAELDKVTSEPQLLQAEFRPAVGEVQGLASRPDGNNVSLEREGLLLAETQLRFQAAVQVLRAEFRRVLSAIREGSTS